MPYTSVEDRKAYFRYRYATDPEFREKALQRAKRRSRTIINAYRRTWRQHPHIKTQEAQYGKSFRLTHRRYFAEAESRRRACIKRTMVERVDYDRVIASAGGQCQICFNPFGSSSIEIDHKIPLAKGGSHTYENLQATHMSCNRRKSASVEGRR